MYFPNQSRLANLSRTNRCQVGVHASQTNESNFCTCDVHHNKATPVSSGKSRHRPILERWKQRKEWPFSCVCTVSLWPVRSMHMKLLMWSHYARVRVYYEFYFGSFHVRCIWWPCLAERILVQVPHRASRQIFLATDDKHPAALWPFTQLPKAIDQANRIKWTRLIQQWHLLRPHLPNVVLYVCPVRHCLLLPRKWRNFNSASQSISERNAWLGQISVQHYARPRTRSGHGAHNKAANQNTLCTGVLKRSL